MSKSFTSSYSCKNFKKNIGLTVVECHGVKQSKKNDVAERKRPEVTIYTCHDALQQLVNSWNYRRIPGLNGYVPVENMCHSTCAVRIREELVAPAEEVVSMFKETGGSLPLDGNFWCFELVLH
ncbi:uncharacterized protein LOC114950982 [Acropora millepora]|uniref:uncharacterized protein LOC114950982 n=1 Tax=Acropora millepora TaxID=45264 RepID=UPI001CF54069|nr:uncharacterized protein LOC114950982 [Acropora millepora]